MPWMPAPAHYSPYISLVSDHGYLVSLAHSTLAPSTISRSGCVRGAILTRTTLLACPAPSLSFTVRVTCFIGACAACYALPPPSLFHIQVLRPSVRSRQCKQAPRLGRWSLHRAVTAADDRWRQHWQEQYPPCARTYLYRVRVSKPALSAAQQTVLADYRASLGASFPAGASRFGIGCVHGSPTSSRVLHGRAQPTLPCCSPSPSPVSPRQLGSARTPSPHCYPVRRYRRPAIPPHRAHVWVPAWNDGACHHTANRY
jgi:hypothetical protein